MRMPREMGYDDEQRADGMGPTGGGSRFQQMMNQARMNDERLEMGMGPAMSPRGADSESPRSGYVSKEERIRASREAVDRQQKMMAKARGLDIDDPTLDDRELAIKRAINRAKSEAS